MKPGLSELSRRTFFKLAGLGVAACSSRPAREILPYAEQPPEVMPGVPVRFATALVEDGFATGVIVETHEGRPTKLEGNPDHPASLGGTRAIEQAAVMDLYDPQRLSAIAERGVPVAWSAIEQLLAGIATTPGAHVVMEPTTSPYVIELVQRLRARFPQLAVTFWSPFAPRQSLAGNQRAFGRPLQTQLDLTRADVVVALDSDLVAGHPMALAYARQLADRRRVVDEHSTMNRLYAIEATITPTGVLADHRFAVRAGDIARIAGELHAAIVHGGTGWVGAIARDLVRAKTRGVVTAGETQPPHVHALAAAINATLGSRCVAYTEPVAFEAGTASHELPDLSRATAVVVLGGDPAYTAPALPLERVATTVYLGLHDTATARGCRFVVPALHDLERWGTARAYDGTLTPIQPMIEPLVDGRSIESMLHALLGERAPDPLDRLRRDFGELLAPALVRGGFERTAAPPVAVTLGADPIELVTPPPRELELEVRPHPFVHDGRYVTNPWLCELPEPITKLTWDLAAQVSPATAAQLGIATGTMITIVAGGHLLDAPVIVVPGRADGSLGLFSGMTPNPFALRGFHHDAGVIVHETTRPLAITQDHWELEHRPIALSGTLPRLAELGRELAEHRGPQPSLMPERLRGGPQWAMSIDLTTCTGCTACVMACAAENNTPVVGKDAVLRRREMHWLRIDRYIDDGGAIAMQPMTCQHCEQAPCEYVCPTAATTHSPDGLNEMTYNRCVGTRFCSNNCPYKVRRFNWFDLKDHGSLRILGKNPDVTIRDRGVMEKCTYCVQRIRRAEIDARVANRPIANVVTACQQACPTQAIAFGSLTDPGAEVTEHRTRPHSYAVLHDQGTRPRTQYLARIKNPNPELA